MWCWKKLEPNIKNVFIKQQENNGTDTEKNIYNYILLVNVHPLIYKKFIQYIIVFNIKKIQLNIVLLRFTFYNIKKIQFNVNLNWILWNDILT